MLPLWGVLKKRNHFFQISNRIFCSMFASGTRQRNKPLPTTNTLSFAGGLTKESSDAHLALLIGKECLTFLLPDWKSRCARHYASLRYQLDTQKCVRKATTTKFPYDNKTTTRNILIHDSVDYYNKDKNADQWKQTRKLYFPKKKHWCLKCEKYHLIRTCRCDDVECHCGCPHGCVC